MINFEYLKECYAGALQIGIGLRADYHEAKHGNEVLHKFCELLVENGNYGDLDKQNMKRELKLLKETLAQEIESYYKRQETNEKNIC